MLINVLNMLKHTAAIVENDWTLWEISSKPLQHTPGTPKYKYLKYVRISLMNRWFRVWGTFQGYVGLSFETPQNNPAILIHIRLDDPVFCGPFFWAPWFWPIAILNTSRFVRNDDKHGIPKSSTTISIDVFVGEIGGTLNSDLLNMKIRGKKKTWECLTGKRNLDNTE